MKIPTPEEITALIAARDQWLDEKEVEIHKKQTALILQRATRD